jgi:protein dithiol oxidoreductase (disulfide-forming)
MKKHLWFFVAMAWALSLSPLSFAQRPAFKEGKHYLRFPAGVLENDVIENFRKSEPARVQVIEFFSYGCSWCYRLESHVQAWEKKKADYVSFHRIPVEFQPSWIPLTKAYYTAEDLKVLDKIHSPLFEAIHTDKIPNGSEAVLGAFFEQQGVSKEDFSKTFTSFDVDRRQKWANGISQAFKITSIPAIVVQGPEGAYLTSLRLAETEKNLFEIVNMLAEKQNKAF